MANRIDDSYFEGKRSLPNLTEDAEKATLQLSIDSREPAFFIEVFGYELQSLMLASPSDPIYEPILEGVEFRNSCGKLLKWEGVNESIANYIYFWHIKENYINNSGAGYNVGITANSVMLDPVIEPARVWNYMNPALEILRQFLEVNSSDYPTLEFKNFEFIFANGI